MHHFKTKIIKMVWVKKYTHILKIKEFFKMIYKLIKEELIITIIIKIHNNTICQYSKMSIIECNKYHKGLVINRTVTLLSLFI